MARIVIDIDTLINEDLTVNQYLYLLYLYSDHKDINPEFRKKYIVDDIGRQQLVDKHFIYVTYDIKEKVAGIVSLRDKTYSLFEGDKDLFLEWFNKYPIKTPSGRVLRPDGDETIRGKKLRKMWNRHFKNKADAAKKAIRVLEAELTYRRKHNSFNFMQMAETWLNQGSYEVYEHLLKEFEKSSQREMEDML